MTKILLLMNRAQIERFSDLSTLPADWELIWGDTMTDEERLAAGSEAIGIFANAMSPVSAKLISGMPNLKLVQSEGVGFDKIDIKAATAQGAFVCNAAGTNAGAVAEQTVLFLLTLVRRFQEGDAMVRAGKEDEIHRRFILEGVNELGELHIGFMGLGAIGQEAAKRLAPFGCKLSYYDPFRKAPDVEQRLGVEFLPQDDLLARCDAISLHMPATAENRGLVNRDWFAKMKRGALLLNTARGTLVNHEDLVAALTSGQLGGAALDTFDPEPPPADHPMLSLPAPLCYKILFSPHAAGCTMPVFRRQQKLAWDNLKAVCQGERPRNVVNGL